MDQVIPVNYLAVFACGIASMVIGSLWYSPLIVGKQWMKLAGITKEKMEADKKKGMMGKTYSIMFLLSLVQAYVLAHIIFYTQATTVSGGLQAGFWIWLGFVVTTNAGAVLFEERKSGLYWIGTFHNLVNLLVTGVILALWK